MKSFKVLFATALTLYGIYYLVSQRNENFSDGPPIISNDDGQENSNKAEATQAPPKSEGPKKKKDQPQEQSASKKKRQNKESDGLDLSNLDEFDQIPQAHKVSLIQNSQIMKDFAIEQTHSDDLVEKLREYEAQPLVMNDKNPYTGSMKVVRTRSPFPGTRYFHAQYFDNEEGDQYVQHMSFEFRPGDQSFEAVKKSIKATFKLGSPLENKEDFISWRQGEDYIIWIKKMNLKDMKDDPFNAYTKEDIGTIRVAKELEIHDQGHSFHMQQGEAGSPAP